MPVTIKTKRLLLRPPARDDIPRLVPLINNFKIASMVSRIPYPYGRLEAEAWLTLLETVNRADDLHLAIIAEEGYAGGVGLHPREDGHELGYWVGEPFWARGYASEAGRALLAYAFDKLALSHVRSGHYSDNPASGRVLHKLGFRYTHNAERYCLARGCAVDSRELLLTRTDWESR